MADIDLNAPEVQEVINTKLEEAKKTLDLEYSGLKKNRDDILAEKKALQEQFESFKRQFEGVDIEEVRTMLENIKKDSHAKLIAEGKWEEVLAKQTEAMRKDYEAKLRALDTELKKYQTDVENLVTEKKRYMVDMQLREVATKYVYPEMLEFLQGQARNVFRLEDDGQVVARSPEGTLLFDKDGKSPLSMESWVLMQQEKYPYIFKQSSGSGAMQNAVKGKGGVRYKEDLATPAAKAKFIGEHGMDAYLDLPSKSSK